MDVQVNTDSNIEGREAFADGVRSAVHAALRHFAHRITRVEVHLSDQNGAKGGHDDKRCMMEARLEGREPLAVTHTSDSLNGAVEGAADKLARAVDSVIGRLQDARS